MKRILLTAACLCLLAGAAASANAPLPDTDDMRLLRMPDISKDEIVFVYGGNLWTVPRTGGEAKLLTTHVGYENSPKFSPDGGTIAFSGLYDGNEDVYVIPAVGGEPTRLTWHPGGDRVIDWQPDGESVRFQTARTEVMSRRGNLWTVSVDGGLPAELPLPAGGLSSYSPGGERIAYNRITREARTWKRYKGGMAQDVWIHDFDQKKTIRATDWEGSDNFPMWHGDTVYFTSDRTGKMQIWAYDTRSAEVRQVTGHKEYDVKWPSLGPDSIVYENGGWLYVLDLATEKSQRVKISLRSDMQLTRPRFEKVGDRIVGGGVAPGGKRAVLAARGEIFSVPAEKGEARNLSDSPGAHDKTPQWSPDGRLVAWISDKSGEYEIHVANGDGTGGERKLTDGGHTYIFEIMWSPDSEKILFYDAAMVWRIVDVESGKVTEVDRGDSMRVTEADWSADSRWVAFARAEPTDIRSIFLYDTRSGKTTRVTSNMTDDSCPAFDPDGKYLYFASSRHFNPKFGPYDMKPYWSDRDGLYLVTLREDVTDPFPPESDEVEILADGDEDEKPESEAEKEDGKEEEKDEGLEIDLEGIGARMVALDVPPGDYHSLQATSGKLFYLKNGDNGDSPLSCFDMAEREVKQVLAKADGYEIDATGEKLLYVADGSYGIVDAAPDQKADKGLKTDGMVARVVPREEWREMFRDAWRLERDFFYDPDIYGMDWDGIYDRYVQLLPYVSHRSDLDYLLGEMISELSAGHAYVYPGENPEVERTSAGLLGCDFTRDGDRYRLTGILTERDWNAGVPTPLHGPGIDVNEGDYLLAVDGVELSAGMNPYALLEGKTGRQTVLKVAAKADGDDAREVTVTPIRSERVLRYTRWVEGNRRRVAEMSGGRIGYLHLPNTAFDGVREFAKAYYPQIRLDGLVVDERYNGGGFIPDFMITIMNQKLLNQWQPRYGIPNRTPGSAFAGKMAMVSNGQAGSGGDALPLYFKSYGLGKVVGTRTWGGLVGVSTRIPLMDGGMVTFPEFGLFNMDGQWDVENYGVDPDIVVDNMPEDVMAGRDPQLEKAVEVLLEDIKSGVDLPETPPFPRNR